MTESKMKNRYNLLDEKFIPMSRCDKKNGGIELFSLKDVFTKARELNFVVGRAWDQIAVMNLVLAVTQRALGKEILANEDTWFGSIDMIQENSLRYLEDHRDCFFLYGDKPFFQNAHIEPNGGESAYMSISVDGRPTDQATTLFDTRTVGNVRPSDESLALALLSAQICGGGGNTGTVILNSQKCRMQAAKTGYNCGRYSHFFLGENFLETIWLNLTTYEQFAALPQFVRACGCEGFGTPLWEYTQSNFTRSMLDSADSDPNVHSIVGRLVPQPHMIKITDTGVIYGGGGYSCSNEMNQLTCDPCHIVKKVDTKGNVEFLTVRENRELWRDLPAVLGFQNGGNMIQPSRKHLDTISWKHIGDKEFRDRVYRSICLGIRYDAASMGSKFETDSTSMFRFTLGELCFSEDLTSYINCCEFAEAMSVRMAKILNKTVRINPSATKRDPLISSCESQFWARLSTHQRELWNLCTGATGDVSIWARIVVDEMCQVIRTNVKLSTLDANKLIDFARSCMSEERNIRDMAKKIINVEIDVDIVGKI